MRRAGEELRITLDEIFHDTSHHLGVDPGLVKDVQLLEPLFEFSGACAGCGETPYIKLMTQLFGDRALVATQSAIVASIWLAMPNNGHNELIPPRGSTVPK